MKNTGQTRSYEIVTALLRKADYSDLKRSGVPMAGQVNMALRHYLKLSEQTKLVPEISNDDVTTFRCALPKRLCDRIRGLGGRLDLHVIEAVRLWLLRETFKKPG